MLTISVKADFSRVQALLTGLHRQIPFATASALTQTAKDVQAAEQAEMQRVFEQPVAYTVKQGVGITPARKDTLRAEIFLKRKQAAYLEAQIRGGARRRRPFEAQFGKELKAQDIKAAVPGKGVRLNAAGNLTRAQIARMGREVKSRRGKIFAVEPGGKLQAGIYERHGRSIKPLLIFSEKPARYRQRFEFYKVGERVARQRFQPNFAAALERAIATAR